MGNVNEFLNVMEEVIMVEMDLEAEEDEIYREYLKDTMAEIDMEIERLKAVC